MSCISSWGELRRYCKQLNLSLYRVGYSSYKVYYKDIYLGTGVDFNQVCIIVSNFIDGVKSC